MSWTTIRRAWRRKSKGLPSRCALHCVSPMRDLKKSNEGCRPTESVALVRITLRSRPNSCSRSAGPTSIGAAAREIRGRPAARLADLHPIDGLGQLLAATSRSLPRAPAAGRGRDEVLPLGVVGDLVGGVLDRFGQARQGRATGRSRRSPPIARVHCWMSAAGTNPADRRRRRRSVVAVEHPLLGLGAMVMDQQAFVRAVVVELIQRVFDLAGGHAQPEVVAGHGLQRVGLVEHDGVVFGQDARPDAPQGQIAEEQARG